MAFVVKAVLKPFVTCLSRVYSRMINVPVDEDENNQQQKLHEGPSYGCDAKDLAESRGFECDTHFVYSEDGFLLALHRIRGKPQESKSPSTTTTTSSSSPKSKGTVFFMHAFLQSSEAWLCTAADKGLPYILASQGFDVWLGNARGNKYSCKHKFLSSEDAKYWNFSIDEIASIDVPCFLNYVLDVSGSKTVKYVGFSQGTAVGFAAFSLSAELCAKVDLFVALAPTCKPNGFDNRLVDSLAKTSGALVFMLLGRKALLQSTMFWQRILSPALYVAAIDYAVKKLFGWSTANINSLDKPGYYSHIYSYSSVKVVVHWFQMMTSGTFRMYETGAPLGKQPKPSPSSPSAAKDHAVPEYPLGHISVPRIVVCMGGRDSLPDNKWLLKNLPRQSKNQVSVHHLEHYEHLDFIWADKICTDLYDEIVEYFHQ